MEPYGVCSHINRIGQRFEFDTREKELAMIKNMHCQLLRTDFDLPPMKTNRKDSLDFTMFDKMMESCNGKSIYVLGILTLDSGGQLTDEWENYVEQIANRYKEVCNWEILNEVDMIQRCIPHFSKEVYYDYLKQGFNAVKKGNCKAKVLFSGLSNVDSEFLDYSFSVGVSDIVDIMNIHWYRMPDGQPEELVTYLGKLKSKMYNYSVDKPVWLTESGYSTAEEYLSEREQAIRLPRLFLISFSLGVDKVFWYKSRSCELNSRDMEDHFGLWHKDYTPKPAYYAYLTLTKMCPDKSTRPKLVKKDNVYMASWKRPDNRKVWALWTSCSDETIELDVKGNYKIYNYHGDEVTSYAKNFGVSPSVVYIVGAKNVYFQ